MNTHLVTIIVCCYNRIHYLQQTMESIFAQHYKPVEIVVLDDGSTDGTPELIKSYGNKVRYFRQENQGIAVARTNACQHANGDLIAFQDDDDLMHPDRITVLYKALCSYPSAIFADGDIAYIDRDGENVGKRWLPTGMLSNDEAILLQDGCEAVLWPKIPASPGTTLFWKKEGQKIGWFDHQFNNAAEDKDFYARLGCLGPVVYVPKIMSYVRRDGHKSLTSDEISVAYKQIHLFEKHINLLSSNQKVLHKRLEFRILLALKKIALCRSKDQTLSSIISDDFISKVLMQLKFRERLSYHWYDSVKLPLRRMIRGVD